MDRGKYVEAIANLTNATALMSTNAQAWNYLGLAYHYSGKPGDAQHAYERAIALDHDLSEARYNLGCLWLEQKRPDLARTELTAFTLRRGNMAEAFVRLGEAQLGSRDAAAATAAEKSFREALRLDGRNAEALNGLGLTRCHQKRFSEARQFFADALKQQPNDSAAILNFAILCQQHLQQPQAALEKYRQYLSLRPHAENAETIRSLIAELEQSLKPVMPTVRADTRSANISTPVPAPSRTTIVTQAVPLPTTLTQRSNGSPASETTSTVHYAYRSLAKPTEGNRVEAERSFAEGDQAQRAHRLSDAIASYQKATQLDPRYFEAYYNLGLAATEAGDLNLAMTAYENALVIVPDSLDARYNFALLLKQGNFNRDAANELETLLKKFPNETRAHLALANLYSQQFQDTARARPHYLKVLELEPRHPQADGIRHWIAEHRP